MRVYANSDLRTGDLELNLGRRGDPLGRCGYTDTVAKHM